MKTYFFNICIVLALLIGSAPPVRASEAPSAPGNAASIVALPEQERTIAAAQTTRDVPAGILDAQSERLALQAGSGSWAIETFDGTKCQHTALAIDGDGQPHIDCLSSHVLKYAWHDGTNWQIEREVTLALDESGQPHGCISLRGQKQDGYLSKCGVSAVLATRACILQEGLGQNCQWACIAHGLSGLAIHLAHNSRLAKLKDWPQF